MTTHQPPRPTSSPTSSRRRDDLPQVTSSLVPHPSGGRGHSEPSNTTTTNTPPPRPRDEVNKPGRTWLLTDRTTPAWTAVHDLLEDGQWHPTTDVIQIMRDTADLAPRTIRSQLRSASARRWIHQRRNRIRIREDFGRLLEGSPS